MISPQAAYDQASAPVDITHRSKANWSEIEKQSLDVAIGQAKDACIARKSLTYAGEDQIAYARLCDLGQQWPAVLAAAVAYITSKDEPKPQLDQAYAFQVLAYLNMQKWKDANSVCFTMLRTVPYTALTDSITTTTARFLQFAFLPDALDLVTQRQPHILDAIRSSSSMAGVAAEPSATPSSLPLHTLVEHALELAALQQYNNQPGWAAAVVAELDRALPSPLAPDDAILIDSARSQYGLLGTPFPQLTGAVSLLATTASNHITLGSVTVFLLFPPWCAQCIRQEHEMVSALLRNAEANVHMYGLLADDPPIPAKPAPSVAAPVSHRAGHPASARSADPDSSDGKSAADQLRGTPTLVVSPATLATFHATDFPLLIATDHDGLIRLMVSAAPENALVANGPVDQVVDTILQNWPLPNPHPAPSAK